MTIQMMKTTARTGPTTQISPSPASRGCGSESGAITGSVYGLATYIFCQEDSGTVSNTTLNLVVVCDRNRLTIHLRNVELSHCCISAV